MMVLVLKLFSIPHAMLRNALCLFISSAPLCPSLLEAKMKTEHERIPLHRLLLRISIQQGRNEGLGLRGEAVVLL